MSHEKNSLILIVYASKYGQTEKIALRIGNGLRILGFPADIYDVKSRNQISLKNYSAVLLGSPVYIRKTNSQLQKWAFEHREILKTKDIGFFTVSLNAANETAEARAENQRIIQSFVQKAGIKPKMQECFIGSLNYREYNPFIRMIMKRISSQSGGPIDTSQDHELTKWEDVEKFTQEFVQKYMRAKDKVPLEKKPNSEPIHSSH